MIHQVAPAESQLRGSHHGHAVLVRRKLADAISPHLQRIHAPVEPPPQMRERPGGHLLCQYHVGVLRLEQVQVGASAAQVP